jgi:hypothetical protein
MLLLAAGLTSCILCFGQPKQTTTIMFDFLYILILTFILFNILKQINKFKIYYVINYIIVKIKTILNFNKTNSQS